MNKKKLLATLVAFMAMADASALTRTTEGTGEAVLLPYFHAADGETTLFGVTNHSDQAKAVRVAIVEGRNGRVALTFNVYLSARDSWSAALVAGAGGIPLLIANEESCTVPSIPAGGVALRNVAFTGSRNDALGSEAARLQQGSIEMIEMGVPTGAVEDLIETRQCAALTARFAEGSVWRLTPNDSVTAPTGGLSGESQIIDVAGGVAFHSDPVVLDDFSFAPRHDNPSNFTAVRFFKPTASPEAGGFVVDGTVQFPIDRGADAVSLTLMSAAFEGGYLLGDALDASTRYVVALPTRGAYVDNLAGGERPLGSAPLAPFDELSSSTAPYCVASDWQAIDTTGDIGAVQVVPLCEQVNVIDLAQHANEGGDFVTGSENGRVRIGLQPDEHSLMYSIGLDTHFAHGLPAVVQALSEVRNTNAQPGVLASYAISPRVVRVRDYDVEF